MEAKLLELKKKDTKLEEMAYRQQILRARASILHIKINELSEAEENIAIETMRRDYLEERREVVDNLIQKTK